ncbi:hypothetical protein SD80_022820 [Scytonema tolypothrichoides VB-61278]|nr:hypothetical protein SD80_022820 [Scytonema tolypothrichoides VB-61278]
MPETQRIAEGGWERRELGIALQKSLSVISYQLSVTSYQLSVTSYQLSVTSYQLSLFTVHCSLLMHTPFSFALRNEIRMKSRLEQAGVQGCGGAGKKQCLMLHQPRRWIVDHVD